MATVGCPVVGCDGNCTHIPLPYAIRYLCKVHNRKPEPNTFHVTELVSCPRKVALRHRGYEEEVTARSAIARNLGTIVHEYLSRFDDDGATVEATISRKIKIADEEYLILGTPDLIYDVENHEYILDFKLVSSLPESKPNDSHVLQVNLYRWLLADDTVRGAVCYISTRGLCIHPVPLFDLDLLEDFVYTTIQSIVATELPPILPRGRDSECYTCSLVHVCGKEIRRRKPRVPGTSRESAAHNA